MKSGNAIGNEESWAPKITGLKLLTPDKKVKNIKRIE